MSVFPGGIFSVLGLVLILSTINVTGDKIDETQGQSQDLSVNSSLDSPVTHPTQTDAISFDEEEKRGSHGNEHDQHHGNDTGDHHGNDTGGDHGNGTGGHGSKHHAGIHLASWNFEYVREPLIITVFVIATIISKLGTCSQILAFLSLLLFLYKLQLRISYNDPSKFRGEFLRYLRGEEGLELTNSDYV